MFSNGTEYQSFLEKECRRCPHYVHYEEATMERQCCPIEEAVELAGLGGTPFPYEWLDENGHMHRYDCRKKAGKGPRK